MKTSSGNNPSTIYNYILLSNGGGWKLFRIYYCDSAFSSSDSIFSVSIIFTISRSRSVRWPRRVSRKIILWTIVKLAIFFNFVLYILTIMALFEVPFTSYYCRFIDSTVWIARYGFIVKLITRILPAAIVSLISPFVLLRAAPNS